MIEINITNRVSPVIRGVQAALRDGSVENVMGRAATNLVQRHLFDYNSTHPNRLGGRRTNFYSAASRATSYQAKPGEVTISIAHVGIRQRYYGGTIRPVRRKYLTIPAIAEAHGRRASEFNNLQVAFGSGGRPVGLKEAPASNLAFGRKRKDGSRKTTVTPSLGRMVFWFAKQAVQKAEPGVLPATQAIGDAAVQAAGSFLARKMQA